MFDSKHINMPHLYFSGVSYFCNFTCVVSSAGMVMSRTLLQLRPVLISMLFHILGNMMELLVF